MKQAQRTHRSSCRPEKNGRDTVRAQQTRRPLRSSGRPPPYRTKAKAPMQATPVGGEARSTGRTDATDLGFWEPEEQGGGRKGKLHGRSNGVNHGRICRRGVSAGGCGGQSRSAGGGTTRRRSARKGRRSDRRQRRVGEKGEESGDGKRKPQIY